MIKINKLFHDLNNSLFVIDANLKLLKANSVQENNEYCLTKIEKSLKHVEKSMNLIEEYRQEVSE